MSINRDISLEIKKIFDENELSDLKRFMNKRKCLNNTNQYLIYLFHFIQSAGILTTTIAAGYDQKYLVWVGVSLNLLASLITVYEKTNNSILKKLMNDIKSIKDGNYVDEEELIDTVDKKEDESEKKSNNDNELPKLLLNTIEKTQLI
jgi:hypothetical protein